MNNQSSSNNEYFYPYIPNQANGYETPQQFVVPSDPPRTHTRDREIYPAGFYISPEAVSPVSIRPYQPQMQMGHLPPIPGLSNPVQVSYTLPYYDSTSPLSYPGYLQVGSPSNGTIVAASPTSSTGTSSSQGHNSTSRRPKPVHRCRICDKEYDKPNRAQTCENLHEGNRLYICNGDCGVHSCRSSYCSKDLLRRHIQRNQAACRHCGKEILSQNLSRHMGNCPRRPQPPHA